MRCRYRSSSGWTATAVSPSIVSGRTVATMISPDPSVSGYAMDTSVSVTSRSSTSRSEIAEPSPGSQLTM